MLALGPWGSVGAAGALVDRSSQHVRLTHVGIMLRSRAMRMLDGADDARAALDDLVERHGCETV